MRKTQICAYVIGSCKLVPRQPRGRGGFRTASHGESICISWDLTFFVDVVGEHAIDVTDESAEGLNTSCLTISTLNVWCTHPTYAFVLKTGLDNPDHVTTPRYRTYSYGHTGMD